MIAREMRDYTFYLYSDKPNNYGQQTLIQDEFGNPLAQGFVTLAIYNTSQSVQDNINYKDCSYVGLTYDNSVNDSFVIQYGDEKLKVQYVNPQGRLKQVFLKKI